MGRLVQMGPDSLLEFPNCWIPGKKCSKIWVYQARTPREIVLFLEFRKYFSIRHWKLPEIQTGSFGFFAG